jgi:hypothetical protein
MLSSGQGLRGKSVLCVRVGVWAGRLAGGRVGWVAGSRATMLDVAAQAALGPTHGCAPAQGVTPETYTEADGGLLPQVRQLGRDIAERLYNRHGAVLLKLDMALLGRCFTPFLAVGSFGQISNQLGPLRKCNNFTCTECHPFSTCFGGCPFLEGCLWRLVAQWIGWFAQWVDPCTGPAPCCENQLGAIVRASFTIACIAMQAAQRWQSWRTLFCQPQWAASGQVSSPAWFKWSISSQYCGMPSVVSCACMWEAAGQLGSCMRPYRKRQINHMAPTLHWVSWPLQIAVASLMCVTGAWMFMPTTCFTLLPAKQRHTTPTPQTGNLFSSVREALRFVSLQCSSSCTVAATGSVPQC